MQALNVLLADDDDDYQQEQTNLAMEKARLINEIRAQETTLAEMMPEAQRLRAEHHALQQAFQERTDELEARLLGAHLMPVKHDGTEKKPHLITGFDEKKAKYLQNEIREKQEAKEAKDREEKEREELRRQMYGPPLNEELLAKGAKVVEFRRLTHEQACEKYADRVTDFESAKADHKRDLYHKQEELKQKLKERDGESVSGMSEHEYVPHVGQGAVIDSNAIFTPSPYYPEGPYTQLGYCQNLYPITAPPRQLLPVHRRHMIETDPAERNLPREDYYSAAVDFLEARKFPEAYSAARLERNIDTGKKYIDEKWVLRKPPKKSAFEGPLAVGQLPPQA